MDYSFNDSNLLGSTNKSTVRAKHSNNESGNIENIIPRNRRQTKKSSKSEYDDFFQDSQGLMTGCPPSLSALDMFENMTPMMTIHSNETAQLEPSFPYGNNQKNKKIIGNKGGVGRGMKRSQSDDDEVAALAEAMELNKQLRAAMKPTSTVTAQPVNQNTQFQQQIQQQLYNNKDRYLGNVDDTQNKPKAGVKGVRQMSREKQARSESAPNPTLSAKLNNAANNDEYDDDEYDDDEGDEEDEDVLTTKDENALYPTKKQQTSSTQGAPPLGAVKAWRVVDSSPVRRKNQNNQKHSIPKVTPPKTLDHPTQQRRAMKVSEETNGKRGGQKPRISEQEEVGGRNNQRNNRNGQKSIESHEGQIKEPISTKNGMFRNKNHEDETTKLKHEPRIKPVPSSMINNGTVNNERGSNLGRPSKKRDVSDKEALTKVSPIKKADPKPLSAGVGKGARSSKKEGRGTHDMHKQKGVGALRAELDDALKLLEDVEANPIGKSVEEAIHDEELLSTLKRNQANKTQQSLTPRTTGGDSNHEVVQDEVDEEEDQKGASHVARDAYNDWWRKMQGIKLTPTIPAGNEHDGDLEADAQVKVETQNFKETAAVIIDNNDDDDDDDDDDGDDDGIVPMISGVNSLQLDQAAVKVQSLSRRHEAVKKVSSIREQRDTIRKQEEESASVKLQSIGRQSEAKKQVAALRREAFMKQQQQNAAIKVQSLSRQNEAKKRVTLIRKETYLKEKQIQEEESAALKLQSLSRQNEAKKKVNSLREAQQQRHEEEEEDNYSDDNFDESEADTFLTSFNSLKVKDLRISPISSPRVDHGKSMRSSINSDVSEEEDARYDDVSDEVLPDSYLGNESNGMGVNKIPTKSRTKASTVSKQTSSVTLAAMSPLMGTEGDISETQWNMKSNQQRVKQVRVDKGELKLKRRNETGDARADAMPFSP